MSKDAISVKPLACRLAFFIASLPVASIPIASFPLVPLIFDISVADISVANWDSC
jgi:hypothetical protein